MPDVHFSLLGPVEVRRGETVLNVGSAQQQAMLVTMALRSGRTATATDLLEALWGDEAPTAAVTTIRTYAWRLRKILEPDRKAPSVLVSLGDGYRLVLPDGCVDVARAQELAQRAEKSRIAGELMACHKFLNEALSLWRGEPLAGIPGPFADRQRERLKELRLILLEERIDTGLSLGHGPRYIPELTALINEHVLRERLYCLLMRAQFRAGRQAEAMATFRRIRQLLINELGVEPGRELESLHQRILKGDPELTGTGREDPTDGQSDDAALPTRRSSVERAELAAPARQTLVPAQLPPVPYDFTGRSHLTVTLCSVLNTTGRRVLPIVVVAGMGGVGKSALSLHVAHRVRDAYPDGQLYAELRGWNRNPARPDVVLTAFLTALGVSSEVIPDGLEAKAGLFRSLVDRRRILVVLDDARDAEQVRALLPGTADCGVLITSRSRLVGLPAAIQTDLDVFYPSEALALLARSVGRDRVAAEQESAHALVEACGYLPLAVRIVAARLAARRSWSISSLAKRLANERGRLDELRVGDFAVAAAFELGYQQLTPAQTYAFRMAASVDGTDISLASAAALLGASPSASEDLLESLVDAAMLESPSPNKYRYHDLLRAFARQKAPNEQRPALSRLLDFLLASAGSAFQLAVPGDLLSGTLGPTRSAGLSFATLADARAWGESERESALALAGQIADMAVTDASDRSPTQDMPDLRSSIDLLIALSPFRPDSPDGESAVIKQLIEAASRSGDPRSLGRAYFLYGNIAIVAGHLDKAEEATRRAVELCRDTDDTVMLRQSLNDLGLITQLQGHYEEAITRFQEAIVLARQLGHRSGEIATTVNSALAHVYQGSAENAVAICTRVLSEWGTFTDQEAKAYTYYVLGLAYHTLGKYSEAKEFHQSCLRLCTAAGLQGRERQARARLAETLRALRQPDLAVVEAERALSLCGENGNVRDQAQALFALGAAESDLGLVQEARSHLYKALGLLEQLGLPEADKVRRLLSALDGVGLGGVLGSASGQGVGRASD